MNRDFKRLAKGQFSDRGPNLFGKSFGVEQRLWHGLERCGVPEVPFGEAAKVQAPGSLPSLGPFSQKSCSFQAPQRTNKPAANSSGSHQTSSIISMLRKSCPSASVRS